MSTETLIRDSEQLCVPEDTRLPFKTPTDQRDYLVRENADLKLALIESRQRIQNLGDELQRSLGARDQLEREMTATKTERDEWRARVVAKLPY